jgi:methyl-accepting chemotaxis protein
MRSIELKIILMGSGLLTAQFLASVYLLNTDLAPAARAVLLLALLVVGAGILLFSTHQSFRALRGLIRQIMLGRRVDRPVSATPEWAELADALRIYVEGVHNETAALRDALKSAVSGAQKMQAVFDSVGSRLRTQQAAAAEQAAMWKDVSSAVDELERDSARATEPLTQLDGDLQKLVGQLKIMVERTRDIRRAQAARVRRVVAIAGRFDEIKEVIRRIHAINDQTKIISFNAAIEASSSGEIGRRFSIVASDMRKLAMNIDEAHEEVRSTVEQMKGEMVELVQSAESGGGHLEEVTGWLEQLVPQGEHVCGELSESSSTLRRLAGLARRIRDLMQPLDGVRNMAEEQDGLLRQVDESLAVSRQITETIHPTNHRS